MSKSISNSRRGKYATPGRPAHAVTETNKAVISALKAQGAANEIISEYIGIDRKTLEKHYFDELRVGRDKVLLRIGLGVITKALQGDNACAFFVLKTQAGWRETTHHEHSGAVRVPTDVSDENLESRLDQLLRKAGMIATTSVIEAIETE